jgi:alanine-alpha-ketoisovalerate/valine-pyruvate aminotransferase
MEVVHQKKKTQKSSKNLQNIVKSLFFYYFAFWYMSDLRSNKMKKVILNILNNVSVYLGTFLSSNLFVPTIPSLERDVD